MNTAQQEVTHRLRSNNGGMVWSENEYNLFVDTVARGLYSKEHKNLKSAALAAQNMLPEDRRRSAPAIMAYVHNGKGVKAKILERVNELSVQAARSKEEEIATKEISSVAPVVEDSEVKAVQTISEASDVIAEKLISSIDMWAEALAKEVGKRFKRHLENTIEGLFNDSMDELSAKLGKKLQNRELLRRKVLVVGPLPQQQENLKKKFSDVFDLRFAEVSTNMGQIKSLAANCSNVVLMVDKINHTHQSAVRHHPGLKMVSGGETALENALTELYIQ